MPIIQDIKTHENLQHLLEDLDEVILKLEGNVGGRAEDIIKKNSPLFGERLLAYLKEEKSEGNAIAEALNDLKKELEKIETLDLSVAITPSDKFIDAVFEWVRKNLGDKVVVNFKKNPSIVGGAIVSYKGQYGDFSISKKLKKELNRLRDQKAQI